jgi:hypothetical protein
LARFKVIYSNFLEDDASKEGHKALKAYVDFAERHPFIDSSDLLQCESNGSDGTDLSGCVKVYVAEWGIIFKLALDENRRPVLKAIAFGIRHPHRDSDEYSVYVKAHIRLHNF